MLILSFGPKVNQNAWSVLLNKEEMTNLKRKTLINSFVSQLISFLPGETLLGAIQPCLFLTYFLPAVAVSALGEKF